MVMAIEAKGVSYAVRSGLLMRKKTLVNDLSFSLETGRSLGFIGPNGAGKTTTIKLCTGILKPERGDILIQGKPVSRQESKCRFGLLTEFQYVPPFLTVTEWLRTLGILSGLSPQNIQQTLPGILEEFELSSLASSQMNTLSKGQVQRTGFAQAFLNHPDILFLDEPMSGMDPLWRSKIHDRLVKFKTEGGTLFFSSHIMSDILSLSDQLVWIDQGTIKWQGDMATINRKVSQYRAVIHAQNIDRVKTILGPEGLISLPDGSYCFSLGQNQKKRIFEMDHDGVLSLISLSPVYPDLEEMVR